MSNLPIGAEYDSHAPFNIHETIYNFDCVITGNLYVEHETLHDEKSEDVKNIIQDRLKHLLSLYGDFEIDVIDAAINSSCLSE